MYQASEQWQQQLASERERAKTRLAVTAGEASQLKSALRDELAKRHAPRTARPHRNAHPDHGSAPPHSPQPTRARARARARTRTRTRTRTQSRALALSRHAADRRAAETTAELAVARQARREAVAQRSCQTSSRPKPPPELSPPISPQARLETEAMLQAASGRAARLRQTSEQQACTRHCKPLRATASLCAPPPAACRLRRYPRCRRSPRRGRPRWAAFPAS